jgi:hypothetical protein
METWRNSGTAARQKCRAHTWAQPWDLAEHMTRFVASLARKLSLQDFQSVSHGQIPADEPTADATVLEEV